MNQATTMPVTLAIAATDRSISEQRITKVSPTAMIPVIETWFRMLKKFAVVRNEGLAALKKITRQRSVAKGAMLRSWLLNQSPRLRRSGAATWIRHRHRTLPPKPLRAAGPC